MAQDTDTETAAAGAYKSAGERVSRDTAKVRELQQVANLIISYCGGMRGVDQLANLKVLAKVRPGTDTNLYLLERSLRDAGMAVLRDYTERAAPDFDSKPTEEAAKEWANDTKVIPLLRNALSIGADEAGLARVRAAIKKLGN